MHTQTHIILGAALFGRRVPKRAWIGALGGLVPDLPALLIVLVLKVAAIPDPLIFGFLYWKEWWQLTNAISHNFWLWGGVFCVALLLRERLSATAEAIDRCSLVMVFSASAFLHVMIDFLVHREDAHMSFWPLTRWKFMSPVSYYDPGHYGRYFTVFEAVLGIAMAMLLFARFSNRCVRTALAIATLLYVGIPAYFTIL